MSWLLRPFCSAVGHTWGRWKQIGSVMIRECRYCNATQKVRA